MKFPELYRTRKEGTPYESKGGDPFGVFTIPSVKKMDGKNSRCLRVLASDGSVNEHLHMGWEHVSVSVLFHQDSSPTWEEMCVVKDLFWDSSECVVQFHVPEDVNVNIHSHCLHMWRKVGEEFPLPPREMV